jgi:hypothetical protein
MSDPDRAGSDSDGAADEPFDSLPDTLAHIDRVHHFLTRMAAALADRAEAHDDSKRVEPEKSAYDRAVPEMRKHPYGSPGYKAATELLGPALEHHFEHNSHHPEHYPEGIEGMDLIDLVEMLCDWRAAAERPPGNGTVRMDVNRERYGIEPQLASILENTLHRYLRNPAR